MLSADIPRLFDLTGLLAVVTGARRGIGMTAMRERAELLQGSFELLRPSDGGTLVRLDVPLTDAYE